MTASNVSQPDRAPATGGTTAAALAIGIIASIAVFGLFIAGVTFLGLAIAFPIAGPVAAEYHVYVPAADLALADRLAGFWWVFGALSVAFVGAAVVVAVKAIERLSPNPRD
jgi:hypothetical protein